MDDPSAERQLILIGAATAARRSAMSERALRAAANVNWERLTRTLTARKLLTTVGPRIVELSCGSASENFAAGVEQALARARHQSALLALLSEQVTGALGAAEIRCAALKGPLLGEAIYGDPGRRLSRDIDVLVAAEDLERAVAVVREVGYSAPSDHVDADGLPVLHFALSHERGERPPVELHWRIHWYECRFARERLLPASAQESGLWRPAPPDELVALLLYYARDGFIDLRLAADIAAWWDALGDQLPDGSIQEVLEAYPAFGRVVPAALKAAEAVVGVPAQRILPEGVLGLRGRLAVSLANPHPDAGASQLYAESGLIDGLLMPRGGFGQFLRRQILLPREVLDAYDRLAEKPRARSSLAYAPRILIRCGVLGRYALALTRLLRTREPPR